MLVIFCDSQEVYRYIKQAFSPKELTRKSDKQSASSFVEYPSKDIDILEILNIDAVLPFTLALPKNTKIPNIMLIAPNTTLPDFQLCVLGIIAHAFPHAYILYISAFDIQNISLFQSIKNAPLSPSTLLYIPLSIGNTEHIANENTSSQIRLHTRPIYFDMIFDFVESTDATAHTTASTSGNTESSTQYLNMLHNQHIHYFFLHASRLWESHTLFSFLIPSHLLTETNEDTLMDAHTTLRKNIDILTPNAEYSAEPSTEQSNMLSNSHALMVKWLLDMKRKCKLTSTESKHLFTLLQGYVHLHPEQLDGTLQEIVSQTVETKEERKILFNKCKQMFMEGLH